MVVGQDADLEAPAHRRGDTGRDSLQTGGKCRRSAAEVRVLQRESRCRKGDTVTIENGKYEVLHIGLEPISVDKNNMNDVIIGSGFHLKRMFI